MSLAETYRFSDFTYASYRELLKLAKERYAFSMYDDFAPEGRFVLWRHDIDFYPPAALELARIEADEGVRSTYFVIPSSEFYCLAEPWGRDALQQLLAMGHAIGLHFDVSAYPIHSTADLERYLLQERETLERLCGKPVTAFAFHAPSAEALRYDAMEYGGMVNSYASYFREQVGYCSDSNGFWRHRSIRDTLLENTDRLQILTHAEWWSPTPLSPRERLFGYVDKRNTALMRFYNEALTSYGRPNVFELEEAFTLLEASLGPRALDMQWQWLRGEHALCFLGLWRIFLQRGGNDTALQAIAARLVAGEDLPTEAISDAVVALSTMLAGNTR